MSLPKESREFFGLSVGGDDGGPAVVINTWERITVERWIFSAAHELGHLILHRDAFDVNASDEVPSQEKEADIFASYFLMPNEAFEEELESLMGLHWVDVILTIKRIFKVSWKTVVMRLIELRRLDKSAWPKFQSQFKNRYGYSLAGFKEPDPLQVGDYSADRNEPETLRKADFPANQLRSLVRSSLEAGKISMGRAAEILGISIGDMRELSVEWQMSPVP